MTDHYEQDISALIRYGVSSELTGLVQAIKESCTATGRPRYTDQSIRHLRKRILCRNLNAAIWQMCHMVTAIEASYEKGFGSSGVLNFFWIEERCTPGAIEIALQLPREHHGITVQWQQNTLAIRYSSGDRFTVAASQINFLSALLEFVWFVFPEVEEQCKQAATAPSAESVDRFSKTVQAQVYAYLNEHTQPLQQQRKFRRMLLWLANQDKASAQANDQTVIDFWIANATLEDADFKLYNTVVDCFITIRLVLQEGRDAMAIEDHSFSIGADRNAGEVDPDRMEAWLDGFEVADLLVPKLLEEPLAQIKFLTASDAQTLADIDTAETAARSLRLSVARANQFGSHQISIGQFIRKKRLPEIPHLITCEGVADYQDYLSRLGSLYDKLEKTRLSVLHVLIELGHADGLRALLEMLSPASRQQLTEIGDGLVSSAATGSAAAQIALQIPEFNQLLRAARATFEGTKRQGFDRLPEPAAAQAYADGLQILTSLMSRLQTFYQSLQGSSMAGTSADTLFSSDQSIFRSQFEQLYGAYL